MSKSIQSSRIDLLKLKNPGVTRVLSASSLVFVALGAASSLNSQAALNLQTFTQSSSSAYQASEQGLLFQEVLGNSVSADRFNLGVHYHFANNPLVELNANTRERISVPVEGLHTWALHAGMRIHPRFALQAELQFHAVGAFGQSYRVVSGDSRIFGKFQLWTSEDQKMGFAVLPEIYLPSGSRNFLTSDGGFGAGARIAFERDFTWFRAAANLGARYVGSSGYRDLDLSAQIPVSISAFVPFTESLGANVEFYRSLILSRPKDHSLDLGPGELYVGARASVAKTALVHAGVSFGQFDFDRSNNFRVQLGVQFGLGKETKPVETPIEPLTSLAPQSTPLTEELPIGEADLKVPLNLNHIRFKTGKADLNLVAKRRLNEMGRILEQHESEFEQVVVEGHTDERGDYSRNQILSEKRAAAVRSALLQKTQMDPLKIKSRGMSSDVPVAYGRGEKIWSKNRRVELQFYGVSADQKIALELKQAEKRKYEAAVKSKRRIAKASEIGSKSASKKKLTKSKRLQAKSSGLPRRA